MPVVIRPPCNLQLLQTGARCLCYRSLFKTSSCESNGAIVRRSAIQPHCLKTKLKGQNRSSKIETEGARDHACPNRHPVHEWTAARVCRSGITTPRRFTKRFPGRSALDWMKQVSFKRVSAAVSSRAMPLQHAVPHAAAAAQPVGMACAHQQPAGREHAEVAPASCRRPQLSRGVLSSPCGACWAASATAAAAAARWRRH